MLYNKFLRSLAPRKCTKETRATREDKRDIMPDCVIKVGPSNSLNDCAIIFLITSFGEDDTQSMTASTEMPYEVVSTTK